jgi:hypothetical protein
LGGLTPNVTSVLLSCNGKADAGLIPSGILGVATQYPGLLSYISSALKPNGTYNATYFLQTVNRTLGEAIVAFENQDITQYFTNGVAALLYPLAQKAIVNDGQMGYVSRSSSRASTY